MPAWEAKKICPDLIIVGGDMNKYIYTSSEIMKILREYTPLVQVFSIDEAFMDVSETKQRFGGEINIAKNIKRRIRERFKITCSIGIGANKLIAKLAGELKKPDGLTTLWPQDIPEKIKGLRVSELCGIGRRMEKHLNDMGIKTFLDLHKASRTALVKRFGAAYGEQLYHMGQGIDNSEVTPGNVEESAKSMGHSYTMPKFTTDVEEVKRYLLRLSEQVGRRLRRDNYKGNIVHLSLGFGNFKFWGKQKKLEDHVDDGYELYKAAEKLLSTSPIKEPCRFVGISVSGLIHKIEQISLFKEKERDKKLLATMDAINNRYGDFKIERLAILETVLQKKTGMAAPREYKFTT